MLRKYVKEVSRISVRHYAAAKQAIKGEQNKILVSCKRTQFNLYENDSNSFGNNVKFGDIPLASNGWGHYKSKGDFFILHQTLSSSENHNLKNSTNSFENLGLNSEIIENLRMKHNVIKPTDIQCEAISNILNGNHLLIAAETGVGKTYAFLLPIIQQILQKKSQGMARNFNTPLALILTPGRELAAQIGAIAEKIGNDLNVKVKVILGGRTKQLMMNPTFEDVDLLIGTIGAVSKLVTTGIYRMQEVRQVVLDEADTLLDDSFNDKLGYFLKRFPFHKNHLQDLSENIVGTQIILASATMPTNIEDLLGNIINTETLCQVVSPNLHKILTHVPQRFLRMNKSDRPAQLLNLIKIDISKKRPVIVFGNKSVTSDFVSLFLNDRGIECVNLNGDMLMKIRVGQFEKFQNEEVNVLATTDIGSRGLDTTRARHIINFDFPIHVADYIHRCGRTGRVGSSDNCFITNFVSSEREIKLVQKIEHAARSFSVLPNVNGNITSIIKNNIVKQIDEEMKR